MRIDGRFANHFPTLRRSDIVATNIKDIHITLHPPRITQKEGIAHIRSGSKTIDRWPLDWFPVKRPQCLIHFYSGAISRLRQPQKIKQGGLIIPVKRGHDSIRMDVIMFPRTPTFSANVRPHVDIVGHHSQIIGMLTHPKAFDTAEVS